MGACRALFQQHIIAILLDQGGDQMIDKAGIDEGRIGRDAHDDVGIQFFGGAGKARQHIVFRPAHHGDAFAVAPFHDRVVARIGGGGDRDLFDQMRALQAMHDVPEQRLAGDGLQHLAGQARRAHARLDDGDDAQMLVACSCAVTPLRLPRRRGCGAAGACRRPDRRAIRGRTSSDGCGPLKPVPSATRAFADARDHRRDLLRQPAMAGRRIPRLRRRDRDGIPPRCAPVMHGAFDHGRAAGVIGPADCAARRIADRGDGRQIGFRGRRRIGRNAMQQGDVARRRRRFSVAAAVSISSIVAMPVESTTGLPVRGAGFEQVVTSSS